MEYPKLVIMCQNFPFALLQLPTFEFQIVAQYLLSPVEHTSRLKSLESTSRSKGSESWFLRILLSLLCRLLCFKHYLNYCPSYSYPVKEGLKSRKKPVHIFVLRILQTISWYNNMER